MAEPEYTERQLGTLTLRVRMPQPGPLGTTRDLVRAFNKDTSHTYAFVAANMLESRLLHLASHYARLNNEYIGWVVDTALALGLSDLHTHPTLRFTWPSGEGEFRIILTYYQAYKLYCAWKNTGRDVVAEPPPAARQDYFRHLSLQELRSILDTCGAKAPKSASKARLVTEILKCA